MKNSHTAFIGIVSRGL